MRDGKAGSKGQKPEVFDPLTGGIVLTQASGILRAMAALWAPVIASVLQMAGSRTREFAADYDGAKLTQDPQALADALNKLMNWKPCTHGCIPPRPQTLTTWRCCGC